MKKPRSTYVHRGDAIRRRNRIRSAVAFLGIVAAAALVIANRQPSTPTAEAASLDGGNSFSFSMLGENRRLRQNLQNALGESEILKAQIDRANRVMSFSTRYNVPAGLAGTIFDVALAEQVDPELAFRLVQLESDFNARAVSRVGAVGLVQVMPSTAVQYDRTVSTREQLYDPQTNLRIGMRYLRHLISYYHGNVRLALLAYNLGEDAVDRARREGRNPLDGYNRILLKAYSGSGTSD